jgi:hypothetical protein
MCGESCLIMYCFYYYMCLAYYGASKAVNLCSRYGEKSTKYSEQKCPFENKISCIVYPSILTFTDRYFYEICLSSTVCIFLCISSRRNIVMEAAHYFLQSSYMGPTPSRPLPTTADPAAMAHFPNWGIFGFFQYFIQHCFICRPSDSSVSEDAGSEPRTVVTSALAVRRSNHSDRSHPHPFPSLILLLLSVQQKRQWGPKSRRQQKIVVFLSLILYVSDCNN